MVSEMLKGLGLLRNPTGASPLATETTRGAEAPQEVVACSIFIIGFGLLVFVERPRHEVFPHDPPNREPRANGLLWSLCCYDRVIQPVQALSCDSFLLFSAWSWGKPQIQRLSKRIS
jgi:hypothetical protein